MFPSSWHLRLSAQLQGHPVKDESGETGEGPAEGYQDGQGAGVQVLQGQVEGAALV